MITTFFAAAAALATGQTVAVATSAETIDTFRSQVGAACVEAAKLSIGDGQASVDPTGSASYGLAVVRSNIDPKLAVICVYDKRSGRIELGSHMVSR
ncbi:MAG: hypothetical protein IT548_00475 [Alphaproteobacteria bacterium]|nr:hypothetical protein [Alphaproteobacteria bacterium]